MLKKLLLCLVLLNSLGLVSGLALTPQLQVDNNTITTNQNITFVFMGLNASQMYIVVFTDHSPSIANQTFTSSGFSHNVFVYIPNDNDSSFTLSLYQYSETTQQNSSSVLLTVVLHEITPSQYNNQDAIIQNAYTLIPIMAIAIFIIILVTVFRKNMKG